MDKDRDQSRFESVYSSKVKAGKRRTYFFDVRQTKGNDYFITITESAKKFNGDGYERHKIFLYKEDFNRFLSVLDETITHIKTELMPDYDYDEFARRQDEYESRIGLDQDENGFPITPKVKYFPEEVAFVSEDSKIHHEEAKITPDELDDDFDTDTKTNLDKIEEDDMSW